MSQSPDAALTPISAEVKARRKRQNRIIVALVVLILIPVLAIVGSQRYSTHLMKEWMAHPTVNLNTAGTVHLDTPGDYTVWTLGAQAECKVWHDDVYVARAGWSASSTTNATGFFRSATFTASEVGDYQVECVSPMASGYALISTESPLTAMGLATLAGLGIGVTGIIVGLVLLVLGLTRNSRERAAERQAEFSQPPQWPNGQPSQF